MACLLNRPLMTLIFPLIGSSGASDLPSSISSPVPLAHQWGGLIPLPMKRTAKRLGNAAVAPGLGRRGRTHFQFRQRLEPGQCHRDADAAEKCPSRNAASSWPMRCACPNSSWLPSLGRKVFAAVLVEKLADW